jgi:hypothetical protein
VARYVVNRGEKMAKEKHHQLLGAFTYLIMDVLLFTLLMIKN